MASQYSSKIPGPGKKKSFLPAPVKTVSALPTPKSPSPEPQEPFRIGDRVCIGGIKFGTLQYIGDTHIATGVWCGVELDEPEGNHDGMVQGHRYFSCENEHGIFAPVDKVTLLEDDIYFEDDYVDSTSEIEEPIIVRPRKDRNNRSRHSRYGEKEIVYQSKSQIAQASGIPKPGSKQRPGSGSYSSSESLNQTSPVKTKPRVDKLSYQTDKYIVDNQNVSEANIPRYQKPSYIPAISRLPKYSSQSGNLVRSLSSNEQIISPQSQSSGNITSPPPEFIDDETYILESENVSKGQRVSPEETYSNGISIQLKSDSRHYLNLTFDPETGFAKNLPDVVASNSPSSENKDHMREVYRDHSNTQNNTTVDSCGSDTLDASRLEDINLLDGVCESQLEKRKRESLSALSVQFEKLKLNTTPGRNKGDNSMMSGAEDYICDSAYMSHSQDNNNSSQDFSAEQVVNMDEYNKLSDNAVCDQMSSSKIAKLHQEVTPAMVKSLDETSRKLMMDSGISEMSASQLTDSMTRSHQMDNIHASFIKSEKCETEMLKSSTDKERILMTDSGISDRGYKYDIVANDVNLSEDLLAGRIKPERPVSLISTTSTDTGYVPDTDSEFGTKTTNSPLEWSEKLGDHTSMTESQIIQYQDSFQEEVKHLIDAQISVDSDVSGTTHDTETDQEDISETHNTETLRVDISQELTSNSSHNSEDDRIEADQVFSDVDDHLADENIQDDHAETQDHPSPGSENSGDVVSVVDNTEIKETTTENDSDVGGNPSNKTTCEKTSPKHATKTEHNKPNTKVASRLADYINTPPPPPKPKDEAQNKKNSINKNNIDKNKNNEKNVANIQKTESARKPKIEKEPPKLIKRTPPKSKWGSIMSQIDKDKEKPVKTKPEVKSKLQEYLSTSVPNPVRKEKPPKKDPKPRSVITHSPKPDYSKVKSRLSVMAPPPKRDRSPSSRRGSKVDKKLENNLPGPGSTRSSRTDVSGDAIQNPSRTPRSSISTTVSKLAAESRRSSISSNKSDKSQVSTKVLTINPTKRNATPERKLSTPKVNKLTSVKSSIPPAVRTPKKVLPTVNERSVKKDNSRSVSLTKTPKASNQNRNRTLHSTPTRSSGYGKTSSSQQPDIVSNSFRNTSSQEVTRLHSLCETRTKELNLVKIELKSTVKALDAMTCLIRYLTEELDAFSCPKIAADLKEAKELQIQAQEQIGDLQRLKAELEENIKEITTHHEQTLLELSKLQTQIVSANESHELTVKELKEQHEKALLECKQQLEKEYAASMAKIRENHEKMHHFMKQQNERELSDHRFESQSQEDLLRVKHLEDIQELRNKHDCQMEQLHKQHRNKLEDINNNFEYIKCSLGEKVECLRGECEDLKYRAKQSEDALLRDTDVRVQMALAPYRHLPEEVDSLKTVVEMRNEEIIKLRRQKMDLEKQLDELPIAREKIISLEQKIENLDAIVNLKSGHEKQLHDKVQILMSKYAKESKANKRLSMDYEELMYKMAASPEIMTASQESLFKRQISRSPPGSECSSPDLRRKSKSTFDTEDQSSPSRRSRKSNGDRKSQTDESLESKIKRRSQTFVLEKKTSTSSSPNRNISPSKIPNGASMSTSIELSDGNHSQLSAPDIPASEASDNELSVSLNELGVAALEDSIVSINSNSSCISDSEVFDSPQKQNHKTASDCDVHDKLELETDV